MRGQLQDFLELVAHVDHGHVELVAQGLKIRENLLAAGDVEGGEGLVEQQELRLGEEGAAQADALALAAGEFVWAAVQERREA
jgi:hypothetical protein